MTRDAGDHARLPTPAPRLRGAQVQGQRCREQRPALRECGSAGLAVWQRPAGLGKRGGDEERMWCTVVYGGAAMRPSGAVYTCAAAPTPAPLLPTPITNLSRFLCLSFALHETCPAVLLLCVRRQGVGVRLLGDRCAALGSRGGASHHTAGRRQTSRPVLPAPAGSVGCTHHQSNGCTHHQSNAGPLAGLAGPCRPKRRRAARLAGERLHGKRLRPAARVVILATTHSRGPACFLPLCSATQRYRLCGCRLLQHGYTLMQAYHTHAHNTHARRRRAAYAPRQRAAQGLLLGGPQARRACRRRQPMRAAAAGGV